MLSILNPKGRLKIPLETEAQLSRQALGPVIVVATDENYGPVSQVSEACRGHTPNVISPPFCLKEPGQSCKSNGIGKCHALAAHHVHIVHGDGGFGTYLRCRRRAQRRSSLRGLLLLNFRWRSEGLAYAQQYSAGGVQDRPPKPFQRGFGNPGSHPSNCPKPNESRKQAPPQKIGGPPSPRRRGWRSYPLPDRQPKLGYVGTGRQIDPDFGFMSRFVIVLGNPFANLACCGPDHRVQIGVVVGVPPERFNPQSSRLQLVGAALRDCSTTWRKRQG